jgi:hypothetical protein
MAVPLRSGSDRPASAKAVVRDLRPTRSLATALVLAGVVLGTVAPVLHAQSSSLILDGGVSHSLPPGEALVDESSSYGLVGARFDVAVSRTSLFFASGYLGLTPDEETGNWASGSAGTVLTFPVGSLVDLGATVWGGAFTVGGRFPYNGLYGRVMPELRLYAGGWTFAIHAVGGRGRTVTTFRRDLLALTISADPWSYGTGAEFGRLAGHASAFIGADLIETSNGRYASAHARASLRAEGVETRLELGLWDTPSGFEPTGEVAVSVPLGGGVRAELYGGRSAPDPLLATLPSADFGAILSWQIVGIAAQSSEVARVDGSDVVFTLSAPGAEEAFVVGDFTLWIPVEMGRGEDGNWTLRLVIEPGRYEFGFIVDGDWYVPLDAEDVTIDEWGQPNATLVVPRRNTLAD